MDKVGRHNTNGTAVQDEVEFFNVLHEVSGVMYRLNRMAYAGDTKQSIEKKIIGLIPAFTMLCGIDYESLREKPKPKTILRSNLLVHEGWGLCPKCGGKCIKVNQDTILVNHPAYCKKCKTESIVTWRYEGKG